jgi:hypothetical protein
MASSAIQRRGFQFSLLLHLVAMISRNLFKLSTFFLVPFALLTLGGCRGSGPSGIYQNPAGAMAIDFEDGKARLTMGPTTGDPVPYEVDGNKITIHTGGPGGDLVLTQQSDGSLQSDMGIMGKVVLLKK